MAPLRSPLAIAPGPMGGHPYCFVENIQPILDKKCISCHSTGSKDPSAQKIDLTSTIAEGWTQSYATLTAKSQLVPRFGARNQIQVTPIGGAYGAIGSGLLKMLRAGHKEVKLTDEELRRFAAWIDMNAVFFGSTDMKDVSAMLKGQPIEMPKIQ